MKGITLRSEYRKAPCKECTERHIGCHGKCEAYKAFQEYNAKISETKRKEFEYKLYKYEKR